MELSDFANGLIVYAMGGCVDGTAGNHVMVAPLLVVEEANLDEIVAHLRIAIDATIPAMT
jgi:adenosylmethionine-8-amino-7-oxononanoate aminotransferase